MKDVFKNIPIFPPNSTEGLHFSAFHYYYYYCYYYCYCYYYYYYYYYYQDYYFSYNGAWDTHIKKLIQNGKQKVNQLNSIISNRYINLSARRMLLLSVLRPSLEYGSEVWESNKSQAASLESIMLGGAKRVLGCSSKTSNKAIWGDMGLECLQGRRDKRSLVGGTRSLTCPFLDRYPKQLFQEEWNIKPHPGRQRKGMEKSSR